MNFRQLTVLLVASMQMAQASPLSGARDINYELPENPNTALFRMGYIDSGLILGRFDKINREGYIFKTKEIGFNFGDIGVSDGSFNVQYRLSTKSNSVFSKITNPDFDRKKPYVIRYNRSIIHNPLSRNTSYDVVAVYPTYIGDDVRNAGLDTSYFEKNTPSGGYATNILSGRIAKVQRWGRFSSACTMTLHGKGSKNVERKRPVTRNETESSYNPESGRYETRQVTRTFEETYNKTVMNIEKIGLNSEEGCRYAEKLLPFGKTVTVNVAQSYTEFLDYSQVATSIHIDE